MKTKRDYELMFKLVKQRYKCTQEINSTKESVIMMGTKRCELDLRFSNTYAELPNSVEPLSIKVRKDWLQGKTPSLTLDIGKNEFVEVIVLSNLDTLVLISDNEDIEHTITIDAFTSSCMIKNLIIDCKGKVRNLKLKHNVNHAYIKSECYSVFNQNKDSSCSSILYPTYPITWLQHNYFTNVCHDQFIKDKVKYMVNSAYGDNNCLMINDEYIIPNNPDEMVIKLKREGDISSVGELFGYLDGFLNYGQSLDIGRNTRIKMGLMNFHIGKCTKIIQDTYQETTMEVKDFQDIFDIMKLHVEKYI